MSFPTLSNNGVLRLSYINTNVNFITGSICEYDIKAAVLYIMREQLVELYETKSITKEEFLFLRDFDITNTDKLEYQIFIGKMTKGYKWMTGYLNDYYRYILTQFLLNNNVNPNNVISIKKDALFIFGSRLENLQVGNFVIKIKHEFDLYYTFYIDNKLIEVYSNKGEVVVKNIIKNRYENLITFVHRNLIEKLIPLDKDNRYKLIESFESRFLNRKFLHDMSIYYKTENMVKLKNGHLVTIEKDTDYIEKNLDIEEAYLFVVRPMVQSFIRNN